MAVEEDNEKVVHAPTELEAAIAVLRGLALGPWVNFAALNFTGLLDRASRKQVAHGLGVSEGWLLLMVLATAVGVVTLVDLAAKLREREGGRARTAFRGWAAIECVGLAVAVAGYVTAYQFLLTLPHW